jgi:hypothetical protein
MPPTTLNPLTEILKILKIKFPPNVKSRRTIKAVDVALSAIAAACLLFIPVVSVVNTGITPIGFIIVNNDVKAKNANCKIESIHTPFWPQALFNQSFVYLID